MLADVQVMTEYTTARTLMQGMSSSTGVWVSLLQVWLAVATLQGAGLWRCASPCKVRTLLRVSVTCPAVHNMLSEWVKSDVLQLHCWPFGGPVHCPDQYAAGGGIAEASACLEPCCALQEVDKGVAAMVILLVPRLQYTSCSCCSDSRTSFWRLKTLQNLCRSA